MSRSSELIKPVFIGHGSPMNAVAQNNYTKFLFSYAQSISIPKAIVIISAHWQTNGTYITGSNNPDQIYDFYGFPDELYKVLYSPPGSRQIAELISTEISEIRIDDTRGIDHAGWAVVKHMFPKQNVPVLEMSLDAQKTPQQHYFLGKQLQVFSNSNILFIGSGNMVHNLHDISFDENASPFPWAVNADTWLEKKLVNNEIEEIVNYENCFPEYKRSIPTNEHFLPLIYILGMHDRKGNIKTIYEEIQNGSISMRSVEV